DVPKHVFRGHLRVIAAVLVEEEGPHELVPVALILARDVEHEIDCFDVARKTHRWYRLSCSRAGQRPAPDVEQVLVYGPPGRFCRAFCDGPEPTLGSKMTKKVSAKELVERARAMVPTLRERGKQADALRRVPDETIADFKEAGLFKAVQLARYGGYELDPAIIYDIHLELGRGCASSAWVFGVLSVHSWQMALFPKETQDEVWGDTPDTLIGSSYMPVGKTKWVDGGVELSGRWSFSSGCDHCDWTFLGSFVPTDEGAPPDMRTLLLPRSDYQIVDNWYVSGLKASGSKDIEVNGAIVPEHRMHKFSDGFKQSSPGNEVNTSPVYRYPFGQIHVRSVSTPALG